MDTSNEIGQARQWLLRSMLLAAILLVGCSKTSPEHIFGEYSIDAYQLLRTGEVDTLAPVVKASATAMAAGLSRSVKYRFSADGCARVVNGISMPLMCDFVRVEKKVVVVYRSQDAMGITRYLRLTPTDTGLILDTGTRDIPLKRTVTHES